MRIRWDDHTLEQCEAICIIEAKDGQNTEQKDLFLMLIYATELYGDSEYIKIKLSAFPSYETAHRWAIGLIDQAMTDGFLDFRPCEPYVERQDESN